MHTPVLLKETIEILNPQPEEFFIDGTLGSGGHTASILEKMMPSGKLLAIDWDKDILEKTKRKIEAKFQIPNSKFQIFWVHGNYADLPEILEKLSPDPSTPLRASGLVLDLGFSSEQLEGKGISFLKNEELDMRYDSESKNPTAAEIINSFSEKELADIFWKYGEERYLKRIAQKIIEERRKKPIKTTFDLVEIIKKAVPAGYRHRIHPATRVFQALRIYVNQELENLEKLLKNLDKIVKGRTRLRPRRRQGYGGQEGFGGQVAIISYHSLEDRLVKNCFRDLKNQGKARILTKKPIRPTIEEVRHNPRARSAKLRAILIYDHNSTQQKQP